MRDNAPKSSFQSYFLFLSLVALLTISSFHVLKIDTNAYACSCSLPDSAKDALDDSDAVFSGKVVNISGKHPDYQAASRHDPVSVTFAVDQVWKGPVNSTMTVGTESSEASCGYEFQQDETYVVYAYEKENGGSNSLHTSLCSGTDLFSESYDDLHELGIDTKILQSENETGELIKENKIEAIALTPFELYFEEEDFTTQGPNHNILMLNKGDSTALNIHIKNNDDVPHQITMNDSRGIGVSGLFESFSFEPEQFTVLPHQTNSTKLHITISKDTDTHSKFVTFLAQSDTFGMRGLGFFIVVDREIDEFVDHSMRAGMPGPAFERLNMEISEIDAEKLIDSGFGTPRYLPQGYEFQGMDGSEGHQRFLYSPVPIMTESTGFSKFWNNGGILILYGIDGPNVNNTKSLPFRVAQDEGQQIMINGMMGDAIEKQTRKVAYSDTTYDSPASISFFDDGTKKSAYLRANMPLDELLRIAASIPVYDGPQFTVKENTTPQKLNDYLPILSEIAPLKQFKSGIPLNDIQCKDYLIQVMKHDGSPACVSPETKTKLIERMWIYDSKKLNISENQFVNISSDPIFAKKITESSNQFALDFYKKESKDKDKNIFFSSPSISTAFSILYEGARGETADEMQKVFRFLKDDDERRVGFFSFAYMIEQKNDHENTIQMANALWLANGFEPLSEYVNTARTYYSSSVETVNFANDDGRLAINDWAKSNTQDRIKELLKPGSTDASTKMVITNAIYFNGAWENPFDSEDTYEADFAVDSDKTVKVQMMTYPHKMNLNHTSTEQMQMLQMPYEGESISMLIILPHKADDMQSVEQSLTLENLKLWKSKFYDRGTVIHIPKFTLETEYNLKESLTDMGMPSVFGPADLSGITGNKGLFVSEAVHKAFVDVNEKGTEAAAATAINLDESSGQVFKADRPFIFIIQDNETESILFMGRVMDPAK